EGRRVEPPGAPAFPRGHAAASVTRRREVAAAAQRAAEIRHPRMTSSSGLPPFSVPSGNDRRAGLTAGPQLASGRCAPDGYFRETLISPDSSWAITCFKVSISSARSTRERAKDRASLNGPPFGL